MRLIKFIPLILLGLSSCIVSKKKFDEVNARKSKLEVEKAECEALVEELVADTTELNALIREMDSLNALLAEDTTQLNNQLEDLSDRFEKLMATANKDARNLSKQLEKAAALQRELEAKDKKLVEDEEKIATLLADLEAREKRVNELEALIDQQEAAVNKLKDDISKALLSFNDDELTVEMKDGKVYISLAEQLLFKSGSYNVDSKGKSALDKLANAIKDNGDIEIMVEGHTDNVPMRGSGPIADNWDLSVKRATSIVKILVNSGVKPEQVVAAGRGEFKPKVANDTAENKAKNRRTEIIVSPNLDELFKLLDMK